jgi:hypothetical protein
MLAIMVDIGPSPTFPRIQATPNTVSERRPNGVFGFIPECPRVAVVSC